MVLRVLTPRMLPRLRPRLWSEAARVGVFAHAFDEIVPARDLRLKYVVSYTPYIGGFGELYAFVLENDIDALMCVWKDPDGVTHWEVSRMAGTTLDIYFDGELVKTFLRGTDIGYVGWAERPA